MASLEAKKKALFAFSGPMAAVATPYDKNGHLDTSHIKAYASYLARIGVQGVYIIGTTGEGYSLSLAEKLSLVEAWRTALDALPADRRLVAVVNVSSTVVTEAVTLAARVEELGFDGVALLPPIYYVAPSKDHLVEYISDIQSRGAPNTPLLYYHIPSFTGELKFELESFLESALHSIPQLCALKFTDSNLIRFASIQTKFGDRINFFAGFDETLLTVRALGGRTAICATFSFADSVAHYRALVEAFDGHDLKKAQHHQSAIADICAKLREGGNFFASLKRELNKAVAGEGLFFGTPRSPILIK